MFSMLVVALVSLCFTSAAHAMHFPNVTASSTSEGTSTRTIHSTSTHFETVTVAAKTCAPRCDVWANYLRHTWSYFPPPTHSYSVSIPTLTAATVYYIVNRRTNSTRTVTSTNDLGNVVRYTPPPPPPPPPNTTEHSIVTYATAWNASTTTTIFYPTPFIEYPMSYFWSGIIPTTNVGGKTTCSTDRWGMVPYSSYQTPAQPSPSPIDPNDPYGRNYMLVWPYYGCYEPAYTQINPNDAAFKYCAPPVNCTLAPLGNLGLNVTDSSTVAPATAVPTASFLTQVHTTYEDDTPASSTTNGLPGALASAIPAAKSLASSKSAAAAKSKAAPASTAVPVRGPSSAASEATSRPPAPSTSVLAAFSKPHSAVSPSESTKPSQNKASESEEANPTSDETSQSESTDVAPQAGASVGPNQISIGGHTFSADTSSHFVIGGQTLVPGSEITVDSTRVSLASKVSAVVVNGITQNIAPQTPSPSVEGISLGSETFTPDSASHFVIHGQTLAPGSAITIDGSTVSLPTAPSVAVVNGVTQNIQQSAPTANAISLGSATFTADSASHFVIGGQTLVPGSAITVDGTTVSLPATASVAVVNGITQNIEQPGPLTAANGASASAAVGTEYTKRISGTALVISGTTLGPGDAVTLGSGASATVVSLTTDTAGSLLEIVSGQTPQVDATASSSGGIGNAIMSGLGGPGPGSSGGSTTSPSAPTFTGSAPGSQAPMYLFALVLLCGLFVR